MKTEIDVIKYYPNLTRVRSPRSIVSYTLAPCEIERENTRQIKAVRIPSNVYESHLSSDIFLAKIVTTRAKPMSRIVVYFWQATFTHHFSLSRLAS